MDNENVKKFPITLSEAGKRESPNLRFERYIRQLSRAIIACSLCPCGTSPVQWGNQTRDPQFPPSIWHREIALVKYLPDSEDVNDLFNYHWLVLLLDKSDLSLSDFYTTSINKCPNSKECPYFDLEWKALLQAGLKMVIIFDKESADWMGVPYEVGEFNSIHNVRTYCTDQHDRKLPSMIKIIGDRQMRKRLFPS